MNAESNPTPEKAVKEFRRPKGVPNVSEFLDLTGFYRRFIKDYSKIAKPLYDLTQKGVEFDWEENQEEAFNTLKGGS